jgi:hypothetical protein
VLLNQAQGLVDLMLRKTDMLGKFNRWLKPKFGLPTLTLNMDMHPRLFPREKVETKTTFSKNC